MLAEPGYHTRAFVEWEDWPSIVLIAAQRAGYFAPAPIWTDLRSFDARPFCGAFDAILAGYPCQPFSAAGKRGGADDPRHLWPDVARVIGECRPEWVFLENVAGHVTLGLETVLRELWGLGYTPAAG
ncbi:DNA cytosine methyltransferase, partial [Ruixingdingia sedimenti]